MNLPNNFEDIKFPVNRISDNATFNSRIQLIDENFKTLLNYCNVVDNNLPNSYDTVYSFDDGIAYTPLTIGDPSDHGYKKIDVVDTYIGGQLLICSKSNQIDFFILDVVNLKDLNSPIIYDKVKDKGSLKFINIQYIKIHNDKLYVYDGDREVIYIYNLISFLTNDITISDIKFLKQFNKVDINAFDFNNDSNIYGITENKVIIYNSDFNIKKEYNLDTLTPIDIMVSDKIYLLYSDKIEVFDKLVNKLYEIELTLLNNEAVLSVDLSEYDEDVLYILSNKYIYKYTSSGELVGYFKPSIDFIDFSIFKGGDSDYVFGIDINKMHVFKDKITTYKLYDEVNLLDSSDITGLQISNIELEQDFVYNSILQKTIFNVFLLYNSLLFKPFAQTDSKGVLVFNHLENLQNSETLRKNNIFYGQNEIFSYQTFNRAFKEIYSIQEKMLELIKYEIVESSSNTLII